MRINTAGPRRVTLSTIAVIAHPARASLAEEIATTAGAEALSWDMNDIGCEANHLQAWTYLEGAKTPWAVVLEDDVTLAPNFCDQLGQVLSVAPSPVVSLYLGRGHPHGGVFDWQSRISAKIATEVCWLTAESLLSAQGVAIRTELLTDMLEFVGPLSDPGMRRSPKNRRTPGMPIDEAISAWCQQRGILVSHTRPSIVDHKDLPPLITVRKDGQPRTAKRTAWLFGERSEWDSSTAHLTSLRTATLPGE